MRISRILLGPSTLAGILVMVVLIPINGWISTRLQQLQIEQMEHKDNRIKVLNQILSGIKTLKLYTWEPYFEKQVLGVRDKEIRILRKQAYFNSCTAFLWGCAPFLISSATFAVFVLSSNENALDVKTAFVSLALFELLNYFLTLLSEMTTELVQAIVSIKRINTFLNCEELNPKDVSHEDKLQPLIMENASFSWEGKNETPTLRDISIKVNAGSLVAVVGPVGAGKSSLISALLGEMYKICGYVNTKGTIAYVPQQAWIQNATLKDNITFGTDGKSDYYRDVLKACALLPDLKMLAAGEQTEIGEKGINLSGGQKQRVSLARAVYFDADIYFLDDPLSAVDSHVGKHIFDNVIGPNGLLQKKTRVLVTHSVAFLSQVDLIMVLENGSISECGTYGELLEKKGDFAEFISTHLKNEPMESGIQHSSEELTEELQSDTKHTSRESSKTHSSYEAINGLSSVAGQRITEDERLETGNIQWSTFTHFLKSIGKTFCIMGLFFSVLFQCFAISTNVWLSKWSGHTNATSSERNEYLVVYLLLGLGQGIWESIADTAVLLGVWKSAKVMHNLLLHNILRVPLSFMDTTPIGRILSRFSKDVDAVDNKFTFILNDLMICLGDMVSTILVICFTTPLSLGVLIPLGLLYYLIQRLYIATSRQLKRLNSIAVSPIYSHFGESVTGAQSIRAYGLQEEFTRQAESKVDLYHGSYHSYWSSNRWLAVRVENISNVIIFFTALFSVLEKGRLKPESVGLSVSYAFTITYTLNWFIRSVSDFETNFVSVERIKEYEDVPQEAAWTKDDEEVPDGWPRKGELVFRDFKLRYREGLDLVLKGLSFRVNDGEKIGIVGRTGAGKSSLTLSLFRMIESAGGRIIVDGVDISTLGLHTLRSQLTIIPQDPVLFSSTLRVNLDPEGRYSDANIWRALELAHLKTHVSNFDEGLQCEVAEGGENFSVGQRHLICLARALLRKTKILILDEATAAIDLETDEIIQTTIRNEFKDCTILTVAHRLNTVIDYDRIMVLDNGYIAEFDTPGALLQSKTSVFYAMACDAQLL